MSQQALDLRRSVQIVRRHKVLVGAAVVLGLAAGVGYAVLRPPMLTGEALVVVPQSTAAPSAEAGTQIAATDVLVAESDPVLLAALHHISPAMTLNQLSSQVKATSLTESVIAIDGQAKSAAEAETIANAVANSYVAYVSAADSPVGRTPARILQAATTATGGKLPTRLATYGLLGALAGLLVGFIIALAVGRNDRRLRGRDEIANAIGVPVIASLPVDHPSDATAWTRLLEDYRPRDLDAWQLRRALQQLGLTDVVPNSHGNGTGDGCSSLAVLSFSADPGALALGPQIASFAASLGIPTELVIGPQQDAAAAAMLRTACAAAGESSIRTRPLALAASDDGNIQILRGAALVVVVVVVDARTPRIPDTMPTAVTVLGVSAGATTAEQIARAATIAATQGRDIAGIIVADPDPTDQTTGRIPQLARPAQRRLPTRMKGIPTEIRQ